jgi:hypothetical protein
MQPVDGIQCASKVRNRVRNPIRKMADYSLRDNGLSAIIGAQ